MFRTYLIAAMLLFAPVLDSRAQTQAAGHVQLAKAQLGFAVDSRLVVPIPINAFNPEETIYLSVESTVDGQGPIDGSIAALWTYGTGTASQMVYAESKDVTFNGTGRTVFQISKPDGWPEGDYHVELFLNGQSMEKLNFHVPRP